MSVSVQSKEAIPAHARIGATALFSKAVFGSCAPAGRGVAPEGMYKSDEFIYAAPAILGQLAA